MTDTTDNQISGQVEGNAVQASEIGVVQAPIVNVTQQAANINNFLGPIDARGATFGPTVSDTGTDGSETTA